MRFTNVLFVSEDCQFSTQVEATLKSVATKFHILHVTEISSIY